MIVKEKCVTAMNAQIQSEFTASAQYIAIAVYFDSEGLPDLANFFYRQAEEEKMHAMKFVRFLLDAGSMPIIPPTPDLRNDFQSATDAVQYALAQEMKVTDQINNLVALAVQENDHTSHNFLQWFITEQVEEVSSMSLLLQTIKHASNNLLMVEDFVRRRAAAETAESESEEGE